ncbi:hypothetical protein KSP39_PZI012713 [Platanthera zijinensis]|uniref:Uncharacterized protein n=1 Tax=Platanthera zijinensis TaxID=2320716 RepID=A0AAP0BFF6_9ASPA
MLQKGSRMGRIKAAGASSRGPSVENLHMIQGFDFAEWLKNMVTEKDFVVAKMDMEGWSLIWFLHYLRQAPFVWWMNFSWSVTIIGGRVAALEKGLPSIRIPMGNVSTYFLLSDKTGFWFISGSD